AKLRIRIMNLSMGHPVLEPAATDPLVRAVEKAVAAGIIVVTSAGNCGTDAAGAEGYAGITSPGNSPAAITVGAINMNETVTRLDDQVTSYSWRRRTWYDGYAKPHLVAAGPRLSAAASFKSSL